MKIDKINENIQFSKETHEKVDAELKNLASYMTESQLKASQDEYISRQAHYDSLNYVYQSIDRLKTLVYEGESRIYQYLEGKTLLPKLTASQLEKLLKAAGAAEDFEISKKWISASEQKGSTLEIKIKTKE